MTFPDIWSSIGMVVPSLFPLAGAIPKLRGFYPPKYKAWFVTVSTVFSLAIYLYIQWHFANLEVYVPLAASLATAFFTLAVYAGTHLWLSYARKYENMAPLIRALVIVLLLFIYTGFTVSLTDYFNTMYKLREYSVLRGIVRLPDGEAAAGAEIKFEIPDAGGDTQAGMTSNEFPKVVARSSGKFFKILTQSEKARLTTIIFSLERGEDHYLSVWTRSDIPSLGMGENPPMPVRLRRR